MAPTWQILSGGKINYKIITTKEPLCGAEPPFSAGADKNKWGRSRFLETFLVTAHAYLCAGEPLGRVGDHQATDHVPGDLACVPVWRWAAWPGRWPAGDGSRPWWPCMRTWVAVSRFAGSVTSRRRMTFLVSSLTRPSSGMVNSAVLILLNSSWTQYSR